MDDVSFPSYHSNVEFIPGVKGKGFEDGFKSVNVPPISHEVWQPQPFDHIKINVDASFVDTIVLRVSGCC